jgi:hypothetical protein
LWMSASFSIPGEGRDIVRLRGDRDLIVLF